VVSWARRTPSSPVSATVVWQPLTCSESRTSFKLFGLSSTMRIAHRNREGERRAFALLALQPDPSAVEFHKLPAQGEPEPRSFYLLGRRPHLAELFEHLVLILGGNADPGVADSYLHGPDLPH